MRTQGQRPVYESGEWEVDLARRELRARGVPVPIGGRAFEIIGALVQSAGKLVTKDDLMTRVWSGAIVEENTLQVHVSAVRKALGPHGRMLKTVSGRGYRLLGTSTVRRRAHRPIRLLSRRCDCPPSHFSPISSPGQRPELVGRETVAQASAGPAIRLSGGDADRTRWDREDRPGAGRCAQPVPDLSRRRLPCRAGFAVGSRSGAVHSRGRRRPEAGRR